MTYGEMIRAARKAAGKTQAEVAEHMGFSGPYLCDLERDRRGPLDAERTMRLADLLGLDADALRSAALESLGWGTGPQA